MKYKQSRRVALASVIVGLVFMIGMLLPCSGHGQIQPGQKVKIEDGKATKIKGVILARSGDTFVLRDISRNDTTVAVTDSTKIRTERKGIFRGNKPFDVTALIPGLILEVKGKGDSQGRLVAEDITFTEQDLKAAITGYVQTAPLDQKLAETGKQVVDANKRISALDEFDVVKTVTLLFPVNSATLGNEQKQQLDDLASKAPGAKNYTVEIKGYADPTGDFDKNLQLSQRRANAVAQYLTVKHNIPLRRMTMPMGYGETKPVGDQSTKEGRAQARRVEVSVMVNKGLAQ